jgi:TetR/AcrR family transcriptional regulator, transcriptional repressor for nem operon
MRYPRDQKSTTRAKILESASSAFRKKGMTGVSIIGLMTAAGLTHGAFYNHFESRERLIDECIGDAMRETRDRFGIMMGVAEPPAALEAVVNAYLSQRHRDVPEAGCPIPSLGADIGRASASARGAFAREFVEIVELIAGQYDGLSRCAAQQQATAFMATLVGTILLARAADTEQLSERILDAGRRAVLGSMDTLARRRGGALKARAR